MKNKKRLVLFIRILCAALIAGLIWGVIYFISPVEASAADLTYHVFSPTYTTVYGDYIEFIFDLNGFSFTSNYVYQVYRCNLDGTIELFIGDTSKANRSVLINPQYTYAYIAQMSNSTADVITIKYTPSSGYVTSTDYVILDLAIGSVRNDLISYCTDRVNDLNLFTDYISYLGSYTSNNITEPYGVFAANAGIQFQPDVYLDSNTFLTFNGGAALNGGIETYEVYIDGVRVSPVNLSMVTSDTLFTNYLSAHPELNILDYKNNNQFSLTVDLTPYAYNDILVEIRAFSTQAQRALIIYAANIHAYPEPDSEETSTPVVPDPEPDESDTESDIETEVPPTDEPGYSQGYADGFLAAAAQSAVGVIKGGTVRAQFTYSESVNGVVSSHDLIVDITIPLLYQSRSYVNFKPVWDYWYNFSNGNLLITDLLSVRIQFFFSNYFEYQPNLIYFSGTPAADPTGYVISNVVLFDIKERAYNLRQTRDDSVLYNRIYLDSTSDISEPVYSIRFDILFSRSIKFWLKDYQLSLNVPADVMLFNTASYNAGLAAGEKIGFDKGEIVGSKVATDKAFSDGKSEGYDIGYDAGVLAEQSNELRQTFKFYDLFFSIFDALSNTFQKIASFEVFGVNVAAFTLGLVTIGIIAFVIRKVW